MASQAALVSLDGHLAYCASKAGVLGMTRVLAMEWGPLGVTVNAISPTVVETKMGAQGSWAGERGEAFKKTMISGSVPRGGRSVSVVAERAAQRTDTRVRCRR